MGFVVYDDRLDGAAGYKPVATVTWSFTTDGAGDASEVSAVVNGQFSRVVTNPDNVDTPTTLWDLTVADGDGYDLLAGNGADMDAGDTGASEQITTCPFGSAVASALTFTVANGGAAKKGTVTVYIT